MMMMVEIYNCIFSVEKAVSNFVMLYVRVLQTLIFNLVSENLEYPFQPMTYTIECQLLRDLSRFVALLKMNHLLYYFCKTN